MKTSYSNKFIRSSSSTGGLTNTLYLTKIKPITLPSSKSKASTDDLTFGSSDMNQFERTNMKKTMQTQQIWYKAPNNNIYDTKANHNHHQIKAIKDKIRNVSENNFDLKAEIEKKKYFSLDLVGAIYESEQIRKKLQVQKRKRKEIVDIYTFRKQNKEICLRNNMIDLLKREMSQVSNREKDIQAALYLSKIGMERDIKSFEELVINHKRVDRERYTKLNESMKYNKILFEKKKELALSVKGLQEDIEKHLREIAQFKLYADFIHLTFNYNNEIANVSLVNTDFNQRDKELVGIVKNAVKQFSFLDNYDHYHPYILDNPDQLAVFFDQVDGNIRKAINEQNALKDEMYHKKVNCDKTIMNMEKREALLKQDLVCLSHYDLIEKEQLAKLPTKYNEQIKENANYINILHTDLKDCERTNRGGSSSGNGSNSAGSKTTRVFNTNEVIKECSNILYKKEIWLNAKQEELSEMQIDQPEQFKKITDKIKQENKKNKLIELKSIAKRIEEDRKLKYLQRMIIYKQYGGIVFPPPGVLNRRKSIQTKNEIKPEIGYGDLNY